MYEHHLVYCCTVLQCIQSHTLPRSLCILLTTLPRTTATTTLIPSILSVLLQIHLLHLPPPTRSILHCKQTSMTKSREEEYRRGGIFLAQELVLTKLAGS